MTDWIYKVKTPCYVIDKAKLIHNLEILQSIEQRTGCKILLAQKAFSMYALYPLIGKYLSGTAASGLYEARLGHEEMGGETHVFSPAYTQSDFAELVKICSHIVFNSCSQWRKFSSKIPKNVSAGIRINPEYSEIQTQLYNPCVKGSRFGVTSENRNNADLTGITGIHFHTMCEQNSDTLERTLDVIFRKFGAPPDSIKWFNFGGGHHITREDYDIPLLEKCIKRTRAFGLQVYLEPGEAVALNAGFLVTEVLDTLYNGMDIAILDASAACHMPDVLEMPYTPKIVGATDSGKYRCRLGGNTCLAGDVIGDYSFDSPLGAGDRLVFTDMAIYTMVKNNTFNGVPLPGIAILHENNKIEMVREFGYDDFKQRL
ncbi:MAG: carboxynorspermidine decarboxylase [Oscillospiraceae bacterium]|nr:carboxynorspermidine decarboxylase [Oscillospiraceae bacterium]